MTAAAKVRPSGLGFWSWNADATVARWRWQYDPEFAAVTNRTEYVRTTDVRKQGRFRCEMRMDRTPSGIERWTVTTCGEHLGSTRHRYGLDLTEANRVALAWLDRRYRAEYVETAA